MHDKFIDYFKIYKSDKKICTNNIKEFIYLFNHNLLCIMYDKFIDFFKIIILK